jgi:hypothetical protein
MNPFLYKLEKELQQELASVLYQEELTWFQRSRAQWLHDGDRNTRYYQVKAANRKRKNRIYMLRGTDGDWIEDEGKLKELVNNFFKELFTEETNVKSYTSSDYKFVPLHEDIVQDLSRQISKEEIKIALFQMGPWKAPGPDGYPAGFYHRNWKVIEHSLCSFIYQMWNHPHNIASINQTDICLIPKIDKPEFVNQFSLFLFVMCRTR